LWRDFDTQWRMGACGPVGIDYLPIQHELVRRKVTDAEYTELMDAIREIETVALEEIRKD
jgi:hypothetical protein